MLSMSMGRSPSESVSQKEKALLFVILEVGWPIGVAGFKGTLL
jgi:hypothetical protein